MIVSGCSEPAQPLARADTLVVRNCIGPAASLPAELEATLAPRTGERLPDDRWADVAAQLPGGFAGIYFEHGNYILRLARPADSSEARPALAAALADLHGNFPFATAEIREARWDFLQLVNWYNYLFPKAALHTAGVVSGDKQETINRIVFGAPDSVMADVAKAVADLDVPCDLVRIVRRYPIEFD